MRQALALVLAGLLLPDGVGAQPTPYRPVTIATVHADPAGFHGQSVMVTGRVEQRGNRLVVSDGAVSIRVLSPLPVDDGSYDLRGVVLDVGRLRKGDPILNRLSFKIHFEEIYREGWPKPGEELVMAAASVTRASGAIVEIAGPRPLPLEVDFSVPVEGEADVRQDTRIRLQFSRELDAASLDNRIRLSYSASDSVERGEAQPPGLAFTITYDAGTRVLEILPTQPLERFRRVKLDLFEGIAGSDGSALHSWSLRFTTGGS